MNFDPGEYYLYTFRDEDCYDDNGDIYFDAGYTLAYCEKFTRDRVHFKVLTWEFGNLKWIDMSFLEYSLDSEKFHDMDGAGKSELFRTVFTGNFDGSGGDQFGFIFNRSEDE